jgi:hypothetical protein
MQSLYQIVKYDFRTSKCETVRVTSDVRNAQEEALAMSVDYVRSQDGADRLTDVNAIIVNTKTYDRVKYSGLLMDRPDGHYVAMGGDRNHNKITVVLKTSKVSWLLSRCDCEKVFELQIVELPYTAFSTAFKLCKRELSADIESEAGSLAPCLVNTQVYQSLKKISDLSQPVKISQLKTDHPDEFHTYIRKPVQSKTPPPSLQASIAMDVLQYDL